MIKHYITKFTEDGKKYAGSWLQINIFGKCFCFSKKKICVEAKYSTEELIEMLKKNKGLI